MAGLNLGLENLQVSKKNQEPEKDESQLTLEMYSASIEATEAGEILDAKIREGEDILDVLGNIESVKTAIENNGIDSGVLAIADSDGELSGLMGWKEQPEITEDNQKELSEAVTEKFGEKIKQSWDAIIKFLKDLLDKAKDFIKKQFDSVEKQRDLLEKLQEKVKDGNIDAEATGQKEIKGLPQEHLAINDDKNSALGFLRSTWYNDDSEFSNILENGVQSEEQLMDLLASAVDMFEKVSETDVDEKSISDFGYDPSKIPDILLECEDLTDIANNQQKIVENYLKDASDKVKEFEKQSENEGSLEEAQKAQKNWQNILKFVNVCVKILSQVNKTAVALGKAVEFKEEE